MTPSLDNQQLLDKWEVINAGFQYYKEIRDRLELELRQRMEAEGATAIAHPDLLCELQYPSPTYDYGKLRGLAELVPPEELAKGFTPAHEETRVVPDKWNMVKIKPLAKYGAAVAEIIEGAAIPRTPRLVIKLKGD